MRWVYRLQQRIAITRGECNVILGLALLFGLGLTVRYLQRGAQPLPVVDYAEADRRFQEASEASPAAPVEPEPATPAAAPSSTPVLPGASINLNTATASALQRLPGIGPTLAARILAHRDAHGPFRRVQDLVQVRGIGAKTLARLAPYLVVEEQEE